MNSIQNNISRRYLVYKALTNLWFLSAVWFYFYRLYITESQIGILDSMAFAIGLIAEVPSGALADRFGRDRIVKIGQVLVGGGFILQSFGGSFALLFIGQAIAMFGFSFISGADDALFFDEIGFEHESKNWRKLVTLGSQITLMSSFVAIPIGGLLFGVDPRLPWILTGVAFILSMVPIWSLKDTRILKTGQRFFVEIREYLSTIKQGFKCFLSEKLILYLPIIIFVQGILYTFGSGILKFSLLNHFQFNPFLGSTIIALCNVLTVLLLHYITKHTEHINEKSMIVTLSVSTMLGLLFSIGDIGMWGFFVIFILYSSEHIMYPFLSEALNKHTRSDQRATVLSVASFIKSIPYIVLAPIIAFTDEKNKLGYFLLFWSILITMSILIYLNLKKRND